MGIESEGCLVACMNPPDVTIGVLFRVSVRVAWLLKQPQRLTEVNLTNQETNERQCHNQKRPHGVLNMFVQMLEFDIWILEGCGFHLSVLC
jgi:hypothetical protein